MYQKVVIVGNLGRDPEMRYTPSGEPVTNFSVATNRRWTNTDGSQGEETVWFRVSVWNRRMAEACNQYLSKGRQVMVEGRLISDKETGGPRIWTDQNGQPRASYELHALDVKFLGGRGDSGAGEAGSGDDFSHAPGMTEDEIPF
jgi:single-strand DNA-binding protein